MGRIGVQMFGFQKECGESIENTLMKIREIGYDSIEICVVFNDEIEEIKKGCEEFAEKYKLSLPKSVFSKSEAEKYVAYAKEIGLEVVSCHLFGIDMGMKVIDKVAEECISLAKNTGINNFVVSYMTTTKEATDPFIEGTNYLVNEFKKHNITLCYHNHDMEFNKINNDETVLDYLFTQCDENLKFQCDIGWVDRAGVNPVDLIRKNINKVISIHLKDFTKNKDEKNCPFVAVGTGVAPISEVVSVRNEFNLMPNGIIIEQDASCGDLLEDVKSGLVNVKQML